MMQFVRPWPELILIEPKNLLVLEQYLINEHKSREYKEQDLNEPVDFYMLFDQLRENDSILFISNQID